MNSGQGTMGKGLGNGRRALAEEVPVGYKRTEVGVIPEDWSVFSIGELFEYLPTAANSRADLDETGNVAYVHYGDIHTRFRHFIDFSSDDVPRLLAGKSVTATRLRDGDLIVADASEDEAGVGKSVEVRNLGTIEAVSGLHTFLLRSKDRRVHDGYRGYLLEKETVKGQLRRLATGLKVFGISKRALGDVRIPLPSPAEQRAIAEVLSDVDGLLPGFSGTWATKRIGDVSDVDPENLPIGTNPDFTFNYISVEQVDAGRLLGYSEERFRTAPSRARRVLRYGDVLMSTVRPTLKAHLLFREQIQNAVCSTGFAVLRARAHLADPGFLFSHLLGHVVNKQIEKTLVGSNYPAINGRDVRLLEIPCPPQLQEQRVVAAILSDMDAEIAALEQRRDKTRAVKQGMMQQLLTGRVRLIKPDLDRMERLKSALSK